MCQHGGTDSQQPLSAEDLFLSELKRTYATEHYEIATYGNLITLAKQAGFDEAAAMLEETLQEEKETLDKLADVRDQFKCGELAG